MNPSFSESLSKYKHFVFPITIGITVLCAVGGVRYYLIARNTHQALQAEIQLNRDLSEKLTQVETDKFNLSEALATEQEKNNLFNEQIEDISSSVSELEKLNAIDEQLLQKYSKVFFLNEHYTPKRLRLISTEYLNNKERPLEILSGVWPHLKEMLEDVQATGTDLRIISAYRSFGEQTSLNSSYKVIYGAGANKFSADQGYSEHQLGTTVDLTTAKLGSDYSQFDGTIAYKWLQDNAYKYGFILSYPQNNAYYQYEPWHWRYVGESLAKKLYRDKKNFYDMDQREIDSYLIKFFD
ncbi:MAG: M15 family metallopeptidase [Candidatus Paceibacterota bacterium]|jgi:D-alanyl-D-alanine carboxypeptidase